MEWHVERNASWKKLKRNQESGVCGVAKESASRFWRVCVRHSRVWLESHGCQKSIVIRDVISDVLY